MWNSVSLTYLNKEQTLLLEFWIWKQPNWKITQLEKNLLSQYNNDATFYQSVAKTELSSYVVNPDWEKLKMRGSILTRNSMNRDTKKMNTIIIVCLENLRLTIKTSAGKCVTRIMQHRRSQDFVWGAPSAEGASIETPKAPTEWGLRRGKLHVGSWGCTCTHTPLAMPMLCNQFLKPLVKRTINNIFYRHCQTLDLRNHSRISKWITGRNLRRDRC